MRHEVAEARKKLLPDSVGDSGQVVRVHFDGNYELPLQVEPPYRWRDLFQRTVDGGVPWTYITTPGT